MSVFNVPLDIVECILFPYLTYKDLGRLSGVCKDWKLYISKKYSKELSEKVGSKNLVKEHMLNPLELLDMWTSRKHPLSCGENHGAMIDNQSHLYLWREYEHRYRVTIAPALRAKPISVSCGFKHTIIIMDDGSVYSMGCNDDGQLGLGDRIQREEPTRISLKDAVVDAKAGYGYTLFLTNTNSVLYTGKYLGLNSNNAAPTVLTPTELTFKQRLPGEQITQIAAGSKHTLILTNFDRLFSAGDQDHHLLGRSINALEPALEFHPVCFKERTQTSKIVQIKAGASHSLVLLGDGTVFTFGKSSSGELGLPQFKDAPIAQMIPNLPKAISVSAGNHHSLILAAEKNKIVAFGMGALGQLGYRSSFWSSAYPRVSPLPHDESRRVKYVSAGNGFSACLASDASEMFACGRASLCAGAGHGVKAGLVLPVFSLVPDE